MAFHQTPEFTEETVPAGLLKDHTTKIGVWAKIWVTGRDAPLPPRRMNQTFELVPGTVGIVIPEVLHHVEPLGPVRFSVEFYKLPKRFDKVVCAYCPPTSSTDVLPQVGPSRGRAAL